MATMLKIILLVGGLSSLSVGLIFLDQYVKDQKSLAEKTAVLELIDPPPWVSEQLKQKIYSAARAGGEDLSLREGVVEAVQKNIESHIVWLSEIQVQATDESLRIFGQWRRPLASFEIGGERFYICSNYFVLDYVPVPALPIVEIKGISVRRKPSLGNIWRQDDIEAAVELLDRFDKMDSMVSPNKPLLFEIESINVSNLDGRVDKSMPHIVLAAKNGTEILWGAKLGAWQRHLEATDKDKIANLYEYYRQHGTLGGRARYINLQYPQSGLSQPVDGL